MIDDQTKNKFVTVKVALINYHTHDASVLVANAVVSS